MSTLNNPSEIARETLRLLASRRTPPTPDNYLTIYHEISGTKPAQSAAFPEKQLRILANALPKSSPDQLRLARLLDEDVKKENWDGYRTHLSEFVINLTEIQKLAWGTLINDLITQWDAKHIGLTAARKREGLEHVLNGSSSNQETLYSRLQSLMRSWGQGQEKEVAGNAASSVETPTSGATATPFTPTLSEDFLPELKELLAFTLETVIASQLSASPTLLGDAKNLAASIRKATSPEKLQEFLTNLKRFAFKLELLAEDQAELRQSLLNLLQLVVTNITELVIDDHWLHGQVEVIRQIIDKPLSQRSIDDAERRLKEVIFKQGQLKLDLEHSRDALKKMLAGFVDHLADFADATSDYHDKIESCAGKISAANDISELGSVLSEVIRETRTIQLNAQQSRDELRSTQQKVKESEARIHELEKELESTSNLVRYDQLTGALNRRGLEEMFGKEIARSTRHDTLLCVGMLDIDNFKKLNDSLGHDAGDNALIHLSTVCREALRPQDTVARYGGEEFIILLPETPLEEAVVALSRLQRELTRKFFMHDNEKVLITFSAGVTQMTPEDTQATVIKRADEAMYEAKRSGKNRVVQV